MDPKLYTPYPYVKLVTARLVKAEFCADPMVGSLTAHASIGAGIALLAHTHESPRHSQGEQCG